MTINRRRFMGYFASFSLLPGLSKLSATQGDGTTYGELQIFREPEVEYDYAIGVHTGSGTETNPTVISVWRVGTYRNPDVQCAEFVSTRVSHVDAYQYVMPLVKRYGQFMQGKLPREPLVSIEQIAAPGDICQNQLRKLGHSRFAMFHKYSPTDKLKAGWRTTTWSRPLIVDAFVNSVDNDFVKISSPVLAKECSDIKMVYLKSGKKRTSVNGGQDNRFMAAAMAVFSSHNMEMAIERTRHWGINETIKA